MTELNYGFTLFLSLLVEALPFLLFGIVVSSWLLVFVNGRQLVAKLPRHPVLAAALGSCLGLLFPVCQYGNVPVARRLLLQGVPVPVAISFLVAAPTINLIAIWGTWAAFPNRPEILLLRVVSIGLIAMIIALIFSFHREKRPFPKDGTMSLEQRSTLVRSGTFLLPPTPDELQEGKGKAAKITFPEPIRLFLENVLKEFLELGAVLIVGCAIAAAIQVIFPPIEILASVQGVAGKILAMLLFGVILSLGSLEDTFFASNLSPSFTSGSLLAFLLLASIIDIKSLSLMLSAFRPKAVIYLLILASLLTFLFALFLDFQVG